MLFSTWKINEEKEYKLRLTSANCVKLEKELGYNPIDLLTNMDENKLPKVSDMLLVVSNALIAYNHGIGLADTYTLFDEWVEDGHTVMDLLPLVVEIYKTAGLIPEEDKARAKEKNNKSPKN